MVIQADPLRGNALGIAKRRKQTFAGAELCSNLDTRLR